MLQSHNQILTVAQLREGENALIAAGISVDALMQRAGRGAADWIWRMAGQRRITVLCGPGNNGGDGYVIAEALRTRGGKVTVVAAMPLATDAARRARALYQGEIRDDAGPGDLLIDCMFGTGQSRPLRTEQVALLADLAARHPQRIAVDLPSGIAADSGMVLNPGLPQYDLTLALGAWKFAHLLMPTCAMMGALRLVPIDLQPVAGAAQLITRPEFAAPAAASHKFRRGLLAVVGGAMPGAAQLAALAAQGAGAGYVKLLSETAHMAGLPPDLVADTRTLADGLDDTRISALLIGPGLGRDGAARERLALALATPCPAVLDADALVLLGARQLVERSAPLIATPHEGELVALERAFDCDCSGTKPSRTAALARASGMVIVAKGPDTVIAAPDGRIACASRASSWLSTAGTGDVLAGAIASRLASGADPFAAASAGVWLHAEAARLCGAAFTAGQLAGMIRSAYAAAL